MPTVNVQLFGSTDKGFAITINPWRAIVSKANDPEIEWISDHPLIVIYGDPGHFPNHSHNSNGQPKAKSGPVNANPSDSIHRYTIQIKKDRGNWITIDPDYRIDP